MTRNSNSFVRYDSETRNVVEVSSIHVVKAKVVPSGYGKIIIFPAQPSKI